MTEVGAVDGTADMADDETAELDGGLDDDAGLDEGESEGLEEDACADN
jgi:hypothetical protein